MPRPPERAGRPGRPNGPGEVIFEFQRAGAYVKVSAVHAETGIEVSIVGAATATQNELETIALRKLVRRLEQEEGGPGGSRPDRPKPGRLA